MSRLRELSRPQKKIIWKKLCEEIQADFIPAKGVLGHDRIQAYHQNWTIIIETFKRGKVTCTRIKAPYVNRDSFYFRIYRQNVFHSIGKLAGLQDIEVGHQGFDKDFIIQGNDNQKLRSLFNNELIRDIISWQPMIDLKINVDDNWLTDPFGEGVSELSFEVNGIISDLQRLKDLYELFAELLNHLCHIGSAYEDDPLL